MKILKITLTLFILLCNFAPVYAAKHKENPDYRLEYLNLKWWENYEDPILNDYLVKAYQNNQDLKIATINVKQAQQVAKESLAQELPHLGIAGNYFRDFHSSDVRFGEVLIPNYNQSNFVLPLTMTYELDLWGENRLKTKSINKQVDMIKQDERATYISLTSTLASTYYNLIKLDKLLKNQTELVKLQKEVVAMTEKKYKNGLAPVTELMQEKQLLTNFEETLEVYNDHRDIIERQMVVLLGDRTNNTVTHTDYADIKLVSIPDNIAAEVIQFRPDMAKTELYIQKTGFDVKAARRDFLPKILIYGQVGFNAYQLSNIFTGNTFKSAAGFAPSLDLFSGGAKMARFRYNKLEFEKAQQMLMAEIQKLKTEFVGTKELREAKDKLLGQFILSQETNLDKASTIGWFETVGLGYDFPADYGELINSVTEGDIIEVANKYFNSNYVLSIVKK